MYPVSWHSRMLLRRGFDWSDQPSGHTVDDASPVACEVARAYLNADTEPGSGGGSSGSDLAGASDADMLRRLNLVTGDGLLTHAGSLLFVGTPWPGIDYIRRDMPGGDSVARIEASGP